MKRRMWSASSVAVATVDRAFFTEFFCSMAIAGRMPSISSTSGRSIRSRNCRTYVDIDSTNRRCPSAYSVLNASDDFPEPDGPVITVSWRCGMSTETFFRLCVRAPRIEMVRKGITGRERFRDDLSSLRVNAMRVVLALLLQAATAFVGVNVVPMDSERVLIGQTVIVDDHHVQTIGPVAGVDIPVDARVVYGRGRWLVPGLIDMHVHIRQADLQRYIENGITTVRDLAGLDSVLAIKQSNAFGPRMFVASKLLTGPNAQNPPFSFVVTRVQDAVSVVDAQLARGCDSIKVYDDLSRDVYDALVNAAHARGVKVAGHVTRNVDVRHAMVMQD